MVSQGVVTPWIHNCSYGHEFDQDFDLQRYLACGDRSDNQCVYIHDFTIDSRVELRAPTIYDSTYLNTYY